MAAIVDDLKRIPMSPVLGDTLARAADYAQAQNHSAVELEHLLLALTEDEDAAQVLAASHVDLSLLKADVSQYLGGLGEHGGAAHPGQFMVSPDLKRILEAAAAAANQGKRREINGAIVLAAIVGDGRSSAAHMLRAQGLTFEEAIKALQRALAQAPPPAARPARAPVAIDTEDVLATARARVQTRAAPSVTITRPEPQPEVRPEPKVAVWPPDVRSSQAGADVGFTDPQLAVHGAGEPGSARSARDYEPHIHEPVQDAPEPLENDAGYGAYEEAEDPHYAAQPQAPLPAAPMQTLPNPPPMPPLFHGEDPFAPTAPPLPRPRPPTPQPGSRWPAPVAPAWREADEPPAPQPEWRHPPASALQPPPLPLSAPATMQQAVGHGEPPSLSSPWPPAVQPAADPYARPPEAPPYQALDRSAPWPEPEYQAYWPHQAADDPRYGSAPGATESAPVPPLQADTTANGEATRPSRRRKPAERVMAGQMIETIPRQMRAHVPSAVEVRLAKAEFQRLADGLQPEDVRRHAVVVAPAMSVKLRAPDGGFLIDSASPETQWLESRLGLIETDFASWRWSVTPLKAGKRRLQLVVSARTPGPDGAAADTALPDQIIDVRVGVNYGRVAARLAGWVMVAAAGGVFAKFGSSLYDPALAAVLAALK